MATVIYSNLGDLDTKLLTNMWDGLGYQVIEVRSMKDRPKVLKAVAEEKDLIIFAGHGTPFGLLTQEGHVFNRDDAELIQAKDIIGLWCNASEYAEAVSLHGFYSGMFISNVGEANFCGIPFATQDEVVGIVVEYCKEVNRLLKNNVPVKDFKDIILERAKKSPFANSDVMKYNYSLLRYF